MNKLNRNYFPKIPTIKWPRKGGWHSPSNVPLPTSQFVLLNKSLIRFSQASADPLPTNLYTVVFFRGNM